jgi:hypothetical protein
VISALPKSIKPSTLSYIVRQQQQYIGDHYPASGGKQSTRDYSAICGVGFIFLLTTLPHSVSGIENQYFCPQSPFSFYQRVIDNFSTMHRALRIPEIQANIIDFVGYYDRDIYELHDGDKEFKKARRNLCAVALTCKTLLPYALDCRWRVIPSLFELLRILPSEIQPTHTRHHPVFLRVTTVFVWLCLPFAHLPRLTF